MSNKSNGAHVLLSRLTRTDTPSVTPPPATTSAAPWSYDVANRLLTRPGVTYTYDNNGNTITKTDASGTTTYTYDFENRLISATMPGGIAATYGYDPFGRRISKTVNGVITRYLYDGMDIVKEYDGTGTLLATYRHGPGIDEPIAMTRGGQTFYYHADGLGSITGLTNSSQTVVQTYGYDGFGNLNQAPTVQNPYTYTGREYDAETGLYYYRARSYDPKTGRFLQQDPIGLAGGINLYAYVGNNPVVFVDPLGLSKFDKFFGLPKAFWNWYHRKVKRPGDPDLSKEEARELYEEWKSRGGPSCDSKRNQRGAVDPVDILFMFAPLGLTPLLPVDIGGAPCELPGGPPCGP